MGLGKTYSTKYLVDSNNNTGAVGEVLVSTATGINWANGSDIVGGPYLPLAGGTMTGTAGIIFPDDFKLNLGAGSDLQIYHDGSNSYINDAGTGSLLIRGNNVVIGKYTGETLINAFADGRVDLYYDNSVKLSTTSTGVEVTGKITNLTAGTGNLDAVNVQQLNDATTGALIFKGTWSAASTTTSTTSAAVSNSTIVVISSSNTGISVGATVTGAALPVGITVTAIAVDEITLTISSAQSITSGATLTFTTVGGIPDLSQAARKVTGDYYICETAGVATPNGAGTTPDDWAVGDWVAFSDLATDAWQKIDNSSVLSGAGTGGTVPVWAGSGTSVTLADAPITVSGNNSTFAGNISTVGQVSIADATTYARLNLSGAQANGINYSLYTAIPGVSNSGFTIRRTSGGDSNVLSFDGSNNAAFAGDGTFSGSVTATTFSGDLNGTINTATTGATQTAGNNSTLIATTAYADAAAAAVPVGDYLPLAGGTMTGNIDFVNNKDISMTDNAGAVTRVMVLNTSNTMYIGPVDTYAGGSILYGAAAGVSFQRFFTGASERLRIGSNGNIAIGTTATSYRLQVEQDNDGNLLSRFHNTAANGQGLLIRAGGVSSANRILQLASENDTKVMTVNSNGRVGIGIANPTEKLEVVGNVLITAALLSNQENTDVDTGAETVASVLKATYTAAFFDFVIKNGTNLRAGTVFACHDGTNVVYTETSTNDLGDTSDVTLSVDISGTDMRLRATATSDNWSVKSLIRAI